MSRGSSEVGEDSPWTSADPGSTPAVVLLFPYEYGGKGGGRMLCEERLQPCCKNEITGSEHRCHGKVFVRASPGTTKNRSFIIVL